MKIYPPRLVLKKGFWYVASPYAKWKNKDDAAAHAAAITGRLLAQGVTAFSPIAHWHFIRQYAPTISTLSHEEWLETDKHFVDLAHGCLVAALPGWNESKGVAMEIEWFKQAGKPINLLNVTDLSCETDVFA